MIQVREAIVVEGRYDKERVQAVVQAIVVETRGFRIFKDAQSREYLKKLADQRGIIILTDSDSAGFLIRGHLKSFLPESKIKNAYIPAVQGKERRKRKAGKEGLLGVEGQADSAVLQALLRAGAGIEEQVEEVYTTASLYSLGLTGGVNSSKLRERLLKSLNLPPYLSTKDILKYLNRNPKQAQLALKELIEKE